MSITASQLIAAVNVMGAAEAEARLIGVGAASDQTAARMRNALAGGALLASAALVAVAIASLKMAGDFQTATNQLVTSAGEQRSNIDMVRQGILDLSTSTATSWQQLTAGMFTVESAGYRSSQALLVLKAAAEGARAESADLASTSDVLTTAMHNYHIPASQAVNVMNSLIATVANGKMHMDDLTGALKNVLPVASAFHIQLSNVEGALDTMALSGDKGTAAGTHLAMMFKMLSNPTGTAAKEMKAMGLDSIQLAQTMRTSLPDALKMIQDAVAQHFTPGSVEYNRAIQTILGGSKSGIAGLELMGQNFKYLQQNTDAAAAALRRGGTDVENWDIIQGNFNFKLEAAKNAVEALMIRLGTGLLPIAGQVAGAFASLVTYLGNFSQHANVLVPILAGMGAVIAAVLVPAVWSLAAGVIAATWPFLAIGVAVAGLVAIFMHFYQTSAPFKSFIDSVVAALGRAASFIVANFVPAMQQIGSFITGSVVPALRTFWTWIVNLATSIYNTIAPSIAAAIGFFKQLWGWIQQGYAIIQRVIAWLVQFGQTIYNAVAPFILMIVKIIQSQFAPVWAQLMTTWQQLQPVLAQLSGVFRMLWATIQQLAAVFMSQMMPSLQATWTWMQKMWAIVGPQLLPTLKLLGMIIGGILVVSLGLLVGILTGVTGALARFLSGAIQVVQGVTQVFTGLAQFFSGILSFIVDLFTGKWGKLAADLGMIWQGILNIIQGAVTAMIGIFNATFGVILGFVQGFADGVIGFFTNLYHALVGGSIVPDMVNGILTWFQNLVSGGIALITTLVTTILSAIIRMEVMVLAAVSLMVSIFLSWLDRMTGGAVSRAASLVSGVIGILSTLAGKAGAAVQGAVNTIFSILSGAIGRAISAGASIANGIAQGIRNGIGAVGDAIGAVVSFISSHLPSSPAKIGPLRELPHMGQQITAQISAGIIAGMPQLSNALSHITKPIAVSLSPGAGSFAHSPLHFPSVGASSGRMPVVHVYNDNRVYLDGHEMAGVLAPQVVTHMRRKTGVRV